MKHKKDLPPQYREYIRWAAVNKKGARLDYFAKSKTEAEQALPRMAKLAYTVQPVLCMPLSMVHCEGEPGTEILFSVDPKLLSKETTP